MNPARAALAMVWLTVVATPAAAQLATTATGPYYATPSWTQKLTAQRLVILANWNGEAVLDRETGLVWERSPDAQEVYTWRAALAHCIGRTVGGRKGWRLPGVQELMSLAEPTALAPSLPTGHPFVGVVASEYWSSTTIVDEPTVAWSLQALGGGRAFPSSRANAHFVWCVRGGTAADAQ
jgi:hypothetical protein